MITWMQRHKKWLVITIWISTIAFVGAGFVGWGSYDFGKSGGNVGKVGDREIVYRDLQNEYSKLYNQYQQMFGASFNNEMAEKLNLQSVAYNNVIQKYLLLNLADELGLAATQTEVAKTLVQYQAFLKDGAFNKEQYINTLKLNKTNPSEFEEDLLKNLSIEKLTNIFNLKLENNSLKNFNNLFFGEDKISIKIIDQKSLKVDFTQKEIIAFYNKNKENYKSLQQYKLLTTTIPIDPKNEKQSKKDALKKYLSAKKGETTLTEPLLVDKTTINIDNENLKKIFDAKIGEYLKPIRMNNSYLVAQLSEIIEPQIQPYEAIKESVKKDFLVEQKNLKLTQEVEKLTQNFKGKSIGFVSKEKTKIIDSLTKEETSEFLNQLFNAKNQIGSVTLADKVIVFKIEESRLAQTNDTNKFLKENIEQIMNNEILISLLKKLEIKYNIDSKM